MTPSTLAQIAVCIYVLLVIVDGSPTPELATTSRIITPLGVFVRHQGKVVPRCTGHGFKQYLNRVCYPQAYNCILACRRILTIRAQSARARTSRARRARNRAVNYQMFSNSDAITQNFHKGLERQNAFRGI